ncbi:MAG: hypothetical protein NVS3B7_10060 [Candidatus Elarobacter sp.]
MPAHIVPLLSSSVCGPLGVKHLPRLWLKILLYGCGRLPEGYRHGVGGFDEFLITTLGIDRDAFVTYIETERPDYLTLERWVREHAATLTEESIATVNHRVENADLPEAMLAERYARLSFDDAAYCKAAALNDLDDWLAIHESLVRSAERAGSPEA